MIKSDLHFHSTYSDGKLSVAELAEIIKIKELKFCALADHNSVDGINELETHLEGYNVKVIPSVEFTAKYDKNDIHILAYDFDVDKVAMIISERNEIVRRQKDEEMKKAIEASRKEGFKISGNLKVTEKQPVTLTVAIDICANHLNQEMLVKRHGKQLTLEEVYYEYQAPGKSCAVERSGVTVEWIVEKFKDVVHDLIIAHPFVSPSVVMKPLDKKQINHLLSTGITGIEVYHNNTSSKQISLLKKMVNDNRLHYTGGSDFHGRETDTPIGQYDEDLFVPDFYLSNYIINQKD